MADQIKQIYAGTATIGQLSDGVAIASTNATTQNTIKDITVQNNTVLSQLGVNTNFVVNGFTEASLNTSVTGSEYIDVSSTAVASATPSFTLENMQIFMPTNGTGGKLTTILSRKVNGVAASSTFTQSAALSTALTAASNIVGAWFIGSDFFYLYDDGNSVQRLYRRVGGINGTENVVFNDSYSAVVFNGVDKFHQVRSSDIRTYTPATNTITSVAIQSGAFWSGTLNSYPRISYANGLVFWANNVNAHVWAINPTTGYNARLIDAMFASTGNIYSPLEVFYSSGTYYVLSVNNSLSGNITISTFADFGGLASASISSINYATISSTVGGLSALTNPEYFWPKLDRLTGIWTWLKSQTGNVYTFGQFNMQTQALGSNLTLNLFPYAPVGSDYTRVCLSSISTTSDTASKNNTTYYPQSISLRVTGVQTTL